MSVKSLSGGSKLQEALADISKRVNKAAVVQVGFLEGATYPDGTSVAMVAAIQNFGAPAVGIPPRPYFSDMITKESPHWGSDLGKVLAANEFDASKSLDLMGEYIGGELQEAIRNFTTPENAESTIARKGFDAPLRDTGHMLNSVDHKVIE